jgi:hypothetical protein
MAFWDRVRAAFKREKKEFDEVVKDATDRGNRALDDKERELNASPEERVAIEQERAAAKDAEYEALRKRIEGDTTP